MLLPMKTTLEISDSLFQRARELARQEGTTLRALTEEGLTLVLQTHEARSAIKVKPVVFNGTGLSPDYQGASWDKIRAAAYEGRGE